MATGLRLAVLLLGLLQLADGYEETSTVLLRAQKKSNLVLYKKTNRHFCSGILLNETTVLSIRGCLDKSFYKTSDWKIWQHDHALWLSSHDPIMFEGGNKHSFAVVHSRRNMLRIMPATRIASYDLELVNTESLSNFLKNTTCQVTISDCATKRLKLLTRNSFCEGKDGLICVKWTDHPDNTNCERNIGVGLLCQPPNNQKFILVGLSVQAERKHMLFRPVSMMDTSWIRNSVQIAIRN